MPESMEYASKTAIKGKFTATQESLGDTMSLVPDHNKTNSNHFAGGGSCLQFVKNVTFVKLKMRYAYPKKRKSQIDILTLNLKEGIRIRTEINQRLKRQ